MPSRPPSASSWRRPMPNSRAAASGWCTRARISPPAPSPALSAPSPTSIPHVEEHVAKKLGLKPEPVSTQVIPRDRHAMFFATLGVIASSIERLATEIRHLQRTEVLEAEEYFSPGPEGLVGDAAQAQPGADRKPHRARAHGALLRACRRWRTWRSGTSATSRIPRSSA